MWLRERLEVGPGAAVTRVVCGMNVFLGKREWVSPRRRSEEKAVKGKSFLKRDAFGEPEKPGRGIALSLEGGPGWEFVYLIMSQISSLLAVDASSRPVCQDGCLYTSAAAQSLNNVNQLSNWQRSGICRTFVGVHPEWGRAWLLSLSLKHKSNDAKQISKYLEDPTMNLRDIFRAVLSFTHLL